MTHNNKFKLLKEIFSKENELKLILDWPNFSGNNRNLKTKTGRTYNNPLYTTYKQKTFYETKHLINKTINTRVSLYMLLYQPNLRRRDIDNYLKIVGDTLSHCKIIKDDSLIEKIYSEKLLDKKNPRIEIVLNY